MTGFNPQNDVVNTQSYVSPYIGKWGESTYYKPSGSTFPTGTVKFGMIMGIDGSGNLVPATVTGSTPDQDELVVFIDQNTYSNLIPAVGLYECAIPSKTWLFLESCIYCQSGDSDDLTVLLQALMAQQISVNNKLYYSI